MSNTISAAAIRHILKLSEQRDGLIAELAKVTEAIQAAVKGGVAASPKGRGARKAKAGQVKVAGQRLKKGASTELILNGLKAAGESGISVKELAPKVGLKAGTVRVWLGTTGKKIKEVEKIGWGRYRFAAVEVASAKKPNSAKKRARK